MVPSQSRVVDILLHPICSLSDIHQWPAGLSWARGRASRPPPCWSTVVVLPRHRPACLPWTARPLLCCPVSARPPCPRHPSPPSVILPVHRVHSSAERCCSPHPKLHTPPGNLQLLCGLCCNLQLLQVHKSFSACSCACVVVHVLVLCFVVGLCLCSAV